MKLKEPIATLKPSEQKMERRPFYYKIDVDNLYRSPNYPDVRMSITFRE